MKKFIQKKTEFKAAEFYHELEKRGEPPKGREQAPIVETNVYKKKKLQQRYMTLYNTDTEFRRFIRLFLQSKFFRNFITTIVFANLVIVAMDNHTQAFEYMELVFFCFYSVEFAMKYYVEHELYWISSYNKLDFMLLGISIVQLLLQSIFPYLNVTYLKVLRGLRALRALRSISLFRSLQVIVNALMNTIKTSVVDIILLLLLVMYLFDVIGYHLLGTDPSNPTMFSDLGSGMYVLFVWVAADGWTDRQSELDDKGFGLNRPFAVVFMFIGYFIFTNLFIAVICNNINDATEAERNTQKHLKAMAKKYKKDVFSRKQKDELIQLMAQQALVGQLNHEDIVPMSHLSCNMKWLETYMVTLKYHENSVRKVQQNHFALANVLGELLDREMKKTKVQ